MNDSTTSKAKTRGIEVPKPPPTGKYHTAVVQTGNLLYLSGQTPMVGSDRVFPGIVGKDLTIEEGYEAARISAMNMIAQISAFLGGKLDRVKRCVRLTVYVRSTSDFVNQAEVAHGASKAVLDVFGEARGTHARATFGMTVLPYDISVVLDGVWEVEPGDSDVLQ